MNLLTNLTLAFAMGVATLCTAAAQAQTPYLEPDNTWVSISGTVEQPTQDEFVLNYGNGKITVEMDDWDIDAPGEDDLLTAGDKVVVFGMIDDEVFETTNIHAYSVFVEKWNSYFYPGEDTGAVAQRVPVPVATFSTIKIPIVVSSTTVEGKVLEVNKDKGELTMQIGTTGTQPLRVDTNALSYNPLDNEGFQQIKPGDRITVTGDMDGEFFASRELVADTIISLSNIFGQNKSTTGTRSARQTTATTAKTSGASTWSNQPTTSTTNAQ